ncbi:sensor histidine kinase [Ohtaekwangia koreensis]|nr:ATP-binding protein [Ohtaekwangia koreensis]
MQKYPTEVHRASTQNWGVVQDKQGTLYFANTMGVLIFDGIQWEVIELPGKASVQSLDIDKNDKVYIGAQEEFGYLKRSDKGNFEYVSLLPLVPETKRHYAKYILAVQVWDESVVFNYGDHGYIYRNGKIDIQENPPSWFYPIGDSVYTTRDEETTLYVYRNNAFRKTDLSLNIDIRAITAYEGKLLFMDDKNQLWLVDPNAVSKDRVTMLSENLNALLKKLIVNSIVSLSDRRFAILTNQDIIIADLSGKVLYRVTKSMLGDSNLQNTIVYEDSQYNLWFTTDEFIGLIITSSPLSYFDKTNGFQGVVYSFGERDGQQYVGTSTGLYHRMDGSEFALVPGMAGSIWDMHQPDDHLYIAHDSGVFEVMGRKATKLISQQYPKSLCALSRHPDCIIMSTYFEGLWSLKKNNAAWTKHKIRGFEEGTSYIQEDDKGNIWISNDGKGIWKLQLNEAMDTVIYKKFYTAPHQLPSSLDNCILKLSDQKMIATTQDGIYSYNASKDIFEPDYRFQKALQGITIYSLAEGKDGQIYFKGKDKMKEIAGVLTKKIDGTYSALFTPFDKITWAHAGVPIMATHEGAWFGNDNKIIVYNAKQKTHYEEPLLPIIKKLAAADSILYINDTTYKKKNIPYSLNSLSFDFNVMSYEDFEKNEFQYKLVGFNKEWSAWSTAREAHFTNLPEGDYTFVIRARNIYRNKSRTASMTVHIDPPVYRTVLAYIVYLVLVVVVFAVLLSWLTNLKTERVNRQKEILKRKVDEKTKKLKSQAEVLKASNYTKDKLFSIISHDMRGPIHQVREIFNMIESGYISPDEFRTQLMPDLKERFTYVATLTDNLLHWAKGQMEGIQVKPSVFNLLNVIDENIDLLSAQALKKSINLTLGSQKSIDVYADKDMIKLVLRNLISNAIKFTPENGLIEVSTRTEERYTYISVRDTGTGLSPEDIGKILDKEYFTTYGTAGEKGSGLGLMLCREFVEKNGGKLTIESQQNIGSTFTFCLPIP